MRIALVLSAGGVRGAAHVGVLRGLAAEGIPIHVIVGVSAGAVVAAYYGAVGLSLDELVADARDFRGRHLLLHGVNVQLGRRYAHVLEVRCGVIPGRLRQLEAATFDTLYHGIEGIGIVCHDVRTRTPRYFCTGADHGVALHEAVKASASIPILYPSVSVTADGEPVRLTDGGVSDPLPTAFARRPPLAATHLIVSDCRWIGADRSAADDMVWIRPRMPATGTLWTPRGLSAAVRNGQAAVTREVVAHIRQWLR
ncbi:MAG TPA: patatin-like phospholipase family protein [Vicinamibacterales bacterium]|nr:patatin-like phospholipase family protein [Vicinamibacterales bacterium]